MADPIAAPSPVPDALLAWLLDGDAAVQNAVHRDLLHDPSPEREAAVPHDGDAATILAARRPDGHWGEAFYRPKWISTHYTLLELCGLGVPATHEACVASVETVLALPRADDGGVPSRPDAIPDVCVNGMILTYASHFGAAEADLASIVDFVLREEMPDGGFNCESNQTHARIASVHASTSVIEGFTAYLDAGHRHRRDDVLRSRSAAVEALLARRLYQRSSDGAPISAAFTRLHHPSRWHFDVLRGLEALRAAGVPHDERMDDAVAIVAGRRRTDGRWAAAAQFPGETHVDYPPSGAPNRWVTLTALRVIDAYGSR